MVPTGGRRALLSLMTIIGGILLASCAASSAEDGGDEAPHIALLVPPPGSIAELLRGVDLIVLGTIDRLDRETVEGPYGEDYPIDPRPDVPQPSPFPFAYYDLIVEEVVSDRGAVDVVPGSTVALRVNGAHASEVAFGGRMLMPREGDRRLFLLATNPDGASYGGHAFQVIDLAGDEPRFGDRERTAVSDLIDIGEPGQLVELLRSEHLRGVSPE